MAIHAKQHLSDRTYPHLWEEDQINWAAEGKLKKREMRKVKNRKNKNEEVKTAGHKNREERTGVVLGVSPVKKEREQQLTPGGIKEDTVVGDWGKDFWRGSSILAENVVNGLFRGKKRSQLRLLRTDAAHQGDVLTK